MAISSRKTKLVALVVDDNKIMRNHHVKLLMKLQVEAWDAKNGKEAVNFIETGEEFDLILMDKVMPVMDGVEATRLLREMGVTTMIVGLGSLLSEEEKQAFMEAGGDDILEKPLSHPKLVSILREVDNTF
ncbi:Two-component response regulator [Thalictrum thalictroides]|uniref:Two-component response regulator n=1 Tax=Thalictrum thalictroides TaxID=46969 RepID=A0A7J6W7T6_THATH|nr:Two-component response regulator [Thalictrum thalictroides]